MPNTYTQIFLHIIFAVKYRRALIQEKWKEELFSVIGNLLNETGSKTIIVNGMEDHVHCLIRIKPDISVSEVVKNTKAKSSKWINESGYLNSRFEWQSGFSAFSCSKSQLSAVKRYIRNQKEHHKKLTFLEEYVRFLNKLEMDYDERYIFKTPH